MNRSIPVDEPAEGYERDSAGDRSGVLRAIVCALGALAIFGGFFAEGYALERLPRALAFAACAAMGIIAVGAQRWGREPDSGPLPGDPLRRAVLAAMAAAAGVWALQLVPLPAGLVTAVSPYWARSLAAMEAAGLAPPAWVPLSVAPDNGTRAVVQALAMLGFALGAYWVGEDRVLGRRLAACVAVAAVLEGWAGLLAMVRDADRASGALVNPNHHAAFVLLGLPTALLFVFGEGRRSRRDRVAAADRRLLFGLAIGGAVLGWLLAFSRGSQVAALAMVVLWVLRRERWPWPRFGRRHRHLQWVIPSRGVRLALAGGAALALAAGLLLGSARWDRFEGGALGRLELSRAALRALAESNLLGVGGGATDRVLAESLGTTLPTRKNPRFAHNDWVQTVVDLGLPGVLAAFGLGWLGWRSGVRNLAGGVPSSSRTRQFSEAAMLGIFGVLVHSLVEFPLRVPLVGMAFLALMGGTFQHQCLPYASRTGKSMTAT